MSARRTYDASEAMRQPASNGPLFEGAAAIEMHEPVRRTTVRAHLRQVSGPPLPSGEERKAAALDAHELNAAKKLAIEYVRRELVYLYERRIREWQHNQTRPVAINGDDVVDILNAWPRRPRELDALTGHWRGAVFRQGFERTGTWSPSRRPELHSTALPGWRPRREP